MLTGLSYGVYLGRANKIRAEQKAYAAGWCAGSEKAYKDAVIDIYYMVSLYQVAEDETTGNVYLMKREAMWKKSTPAIPITAANKTAKK